MITRLVFLSLLATILVMLAASGCTSRKGAPSQGERAPAAEPVETAGHGEAEAINLEGIDGPGEMKFVPADLKLTAGRTYRLTFRNTGALQHDFIISGLKARIEQDAAKDEGAHGGDEEEGHAGDGGDAHADEGDFVHGTAGPGSTTVVVFTPESKGRFELKCSFPGHKEAGMTGTVTVS